MTGHTRVAWALAMTLSTASGLASSADRVPRPEFESVYRPPAVSAPGPIPAASRAVDVAVLAIGQGIAAYLALVRRSRRGLAALGVACLAYFGFARQGCVCPIGAMQNVALSAADRSYALPLATAATFALPLVFALWRGRVFCAGVCPAGALQDLVLLRPFASPSWASEPLALVRHAYLGLAVLAAATGSAFLICSWDPFVSLFHLSGSLGAWLLAAGLLAVATVVSRPYCRFLCPYGVLLGWCARLSARRARTCPAECVTCGLCAGSCPTDALRQPASGKAAESVERGVRRLAWLLMLAPVLVLGAGWLGSRQDVVLARLHPAVRLAERVLAEDAGATGSTLESRTFRAGGRQTSELAAQARAVRTRLRRGGWALGAYLGLVLSAALVRWSRRQRRPAFGPDPGRCLSCGRCFAACPKTRAPLARLQESSSHA